MRGTIPDLDSPTPLGLALPALYHDDDVVQQFTGALDVVLAPVLNVLDNIDAYLDPRLAPLDFVAWLAAWVGIELDETWDEPRQRALVAGAVDLHRWRGTRRGLIAAVAAYTGGQVEVVDTGGVFWSAVPSGKVPGRSPPRVKVTVRVPNLDRIDPARIERIVADVKPAHVAHEVEVVVT